MQNQFQSIFRDASALITQKGIVVAMIGCAEQTVSVECKTGVRSVEIRAAIGLLLDTAQQTLSEPARARHHSETDAAPLFAAEPSPSHIRSPSKILRDVNPKRAPALPLLVPLPFDSFAMAREHFASTMHGAIISFSSTRCLTSW